MNNACIYCNTVYRYIYIYIYIHIPVGRVLRRSICATSALQLEHHPVLFHVNFEAFTTRSWKNWYLCLKRTGLLWLVDVFEFTLHLGVETKDLMEIDVGAHFVDGFSIANTHSVYISTCAYVNID